MSAPPTSPSPALGTVRVLLVEDEAAHAELACRAFEPHGTRYSLRIADSISRARGNIAEQRPDLVLSDWKLPDGYGTDLLPTDDAQIPIVVMTSQGDEMTAVEVMKAGALDYIVKSDACFEDLPRVVERALREWRLIQERTVSQERLQAQYECISLLASARTVDEAIPAVLTRAAVHIEASAVEFWVPHGKDEIRRFFDWHRGAGISSTSEPVLQPLRGHGRGELWRPSGEDCLSHGPTCSRLIVVASEPAGLLVFQGPSEDWAGDRELCHFVAALSEQLAGFFQRVRLQDALSEQGKLAAMGTAAAMFAHEVGNPLNNMFLQAQLLERRLRKAPEEDPVRVGLVGIVSEIRRLNVLLQEFRALARKRPLSFDEVDLAAVLSEIVDLHVPTDVIEVNWDVPDDLPPLIADRDKLVQVFLNLSKNAVEAMSQGGTLSLHCRVEGDAVTVDVADTGPGLPTDIDVFEMFKTTKTQGTGLGLPVVRQIVGAHRGSIQAKTLPQGGALFSVTLPLGR